MKLLFISVFLSLMLFCLAIHSGWAKAPTSPKIVFASAREDNREIYMMNPDGSEQINITRNKALDTSPVWSPTGEQILFVSNRDGVRDLFLMDADGANVRRVFGKQAERQNPTWSPDGTQIAYWRPELGNHVMYIAPIDGTKETKLGSGSVAVWSPDGTTLAYVQGPPNLRHIWFYDLKTHKRKIFFPRNGNPSWVRPPDWCHEVDKIAFSWLHRVPLGANRDTETVYIINSDGTGLQQVAPEAGAPSTSPFWSPRGDALIYEQLDENRDLHLFKIGVDGGEPEQLTHIGWNYRGDWFDPAYALPVSPQPQFLTTTWAEMKRDGDP